MVPLSSFFPGLSGGDRGGHQPTWHAHHLLQPGPFRWVTRITLGWGGTLLRQEALTLVDVLLCAETAVQRKVAEEHHRRGLLVRALQPRSGSHSWGTWPTSCSLSASGCVDGFHHEASLHCHVPIFILDQRW